MAGSLFALVVLVVGVWLMVKGSSMGLAALGAGMLFGGIAVFALNLAGFSAVSSDRVLVDLSCASQVLAEASEHAVAVAGAVPGSRARQAHWLLQAVDGQVRVELGWHEVARAAAQGSRMTGERFPLPRVAAWQGSRVQGMHDAASRSFAAARRLAVGAVAAAWVLEAGGTLARIDTANSVALVEQVEAAVRRAVPPSSALTST